MFGRGDSFDDLFNELNNMFGRNNPFRGRFGIHGKNNVEKGKDENGEWNKETFTSEDGKIVITSFVRNSGFDDDMMTNMFKSRKKQEVSGDRLKSELQRAIENEDYELAIAIRDKMKKLENSQEEIEKLENELKQVISDHNFERAIEIREELKKLKM
jgi:excinuclease UvrABC helicase subunit UvrB